MDNLNITVSGKTYQFNQLLKGRGQSGLAGFYQIDEKSPLVLIKQDNPGTCLAESLAVLYTPPGMKSVVSIIQAEPGVAQIKGIPSVVSIQNKFIPSVGEKFMPFDQIVLGHKRDPKTILSEESRNSKKIKKVLADMTEEVKDQLAHAIYTSQLNGDESLHTGQFVCSVDENNKISKIQRIDFGALGRYALARKDFDPCKTSSLYAASGQFGKDYVSYLLQDKTIENKVLNLWAKTNVAEVVDKVSKRFDEQVAKIDDKALQKTALVELNQALIKKSSLPELKMDMDNDSLKVQVQANLRHATRIRCTAMQAKAEQRLGQDKTFDHKIGALSPASSTVRSPLNESLSSLSDTASFSSESSLSRSSSVSSRFEFSDLPDEHLSTDEGMNITRDFKQRAKENQLSTSLDGDEEEFRNRPG